MQNVLDYIGLIPVVGEQADGINAGIYAFRGDYTTAALSLAAVIPIGGWGATGTKVARKGAKAVNKADDIYDLAKTSNSELHHIATDKSKKFDFKNHPAFKETGINVSKDVDNLVDLANHRGRHTYKYHQEIQDRLDAVVERYGGTDKLESAVRQELNKMKQELLDGKLDPYKK